jgi:hypothetical protein
MSNAGKNPSQVCHNCHFIWYEQYIKPLNAMHLSPEKWHKKWQEMYAKFLSQIQSRRA